MTGRLGIAAGFPPAPAERENALERLRVADELGVDSVWVAEAWGRDAFTYLAQVALVTRRARLGTGIVNVYSRSPAVLAMTYGALDELSDGRMIIGLGSSGANVVEHLHGVPFDKPLRRLREYAEIIDQLVRGEPLDYQGTIFRLRRGFRLQFEPPRRHIPIFIAAVTPPSIRQAGEVADGVMPIHWPTSSFGALRSELATAARAAGRDPSYMEIAPSVGLFITDADGREAAATRAREPLSFYIGRMGRAHADMLRSRGYEADVEAVRAAWERRYPAAAAAAVSDQLLHDTAVIGTLDECAERLDEMRALGADVPVVALPPGDAAGAGRILERLLR